MSLISEWERLQERRRQEEEALELQRESAQRRRREEQALDLQRDSAQRQNEIISLQKEALRREEHREYAREYAEQQKQKAVKDALNRSLQIEQEKVKQMAISSIYRAICLDSSYLTNLLKVYINELIQSFEGLLIALRDIDKDATYARELRISAFFDQIKVDGHDCSDNIKLDINPEDNIKWFKSMEPMFDDSELKTYFIEGQARIKKLKDGIKSYESKWRSEKDKREAEIAQAAESAWLRERKRVRTIFIAICIIIGLMVAAYLVLGFGGYLDEKENGVKNNQTIEEVTTDYDDRARIKSAINNYYQNVADKNIEGAIALFESNKIPMLNRGLIESVANETEYYKIDSIKIISYDGEKAEALVHLYHKKYNQQEEYWELNISMVKEYGRGWRLWSNPGRKIW